MWMLGNESCLSSIDQYRDCIHLFDYARHTAFTSVDYGISIQCLVRNIVYAKNLKSNVINDY